MKIDRLYDDRLAGIITPDFWSTKNQQLLAEQKGFQEQLEKLKSQEADYFDLYLDILKLAERARRIYENPRRAPEEKRLLLKHIFATIQFGNGEVDYTLKTPVRKYAERLENVENIFEPEKALSLNTNHSSDARIASMLPRQDSNLQPID